LSLSLWAAENTPFLQKPIGNDGTRILVRREEIGFNVVQKRPVFWYSFVFLSSDGQEHVLGGMRNFDVEIPIAAEQRPSEIVAIVSRPDGSTGVLLGGPNMLYHLLFNKNVPSRPAAISSMGTFHWEIQRPKFEMTEPDRILVTMNGEAANTRKTHVLALRGDYQWTFDGAVLSTAACSSPDNRSVPSPSSGSTAAPTPDVRSGAGVVHDHLNRKPATHSPPSSSTTLSKAHAPQWVTACLAGLLLVVFVLFRICRK